MAVINDSEINEAVKALLAQQLIQGLTEEHRNQLLQNAVVKALDSFALGKSIEAVLGNQACAIAEKLASSEGWIGRIEEAMRLGFDDYLGNLRVAMQQTLLKSISGSRSQYGETSQILYCWPDPGAKTDD